MEMVQGQLYRVGATCRNPGEVHTVEMVMVGGSPDDIRSRFCYVYDVSDFDSYRIDYIAKEPARYVAIKTSIKRVEVEDPDAVIKRESGSEAVFQPVPNTGAMKFQVAAYTTLYAKDCGHAVKKLGERILSRSESVKTTAEQVAAPSGFAVAKDQSMFPRATFVRG